MKGLKIILTVFLLLQLSSCNLAFLVSKDQEVKIVKDSLTEIAVDHKPMEFHGEYTTFQRDGAPKQIEIDRAGYKTQYMFIAPYKLNLAAYGTIAIGAIVVGVPVGLSIPASSTFFLPFGTTVMGTVGGVFGAVMLNFSPKFWDYDKVIYLNPEMIPIPVKDSTLKEVYVNKVAIDISPEKNEDYIVKYKDYKMGNYGNKINEVKLENGFKFKDTYFSDELNSVLKKDGYIDTTNLVLNRSYNQNASLNATVIGSKFYWVPALANGNLSGKVIQPDVISTDLNVKWDILDFYKKKIYSDTIDSKSGEFVSLGKGVNPKDIKDAVKDALQTSLYTLMNSDKFKKATEANQVTVKDTLDTLKIKSPKAFVNNIEQAALATVTIKNQKGHGSGFFISEDGYVITNYHVIADTSKLEVILNNGSKYHPRIVRTNREFDLALLKIDRNDIIPFKVSDSVSVSVGNEIYVLGTPSAQDLSQTITKGIVSSIRNQGPGQKLIQTDASVNFGSSGGPMIDNKGNLLGIVDAKLVGTGIEGIAFVIPVNELIDDLKLKIK